MRLMSQPMTEGKQCLRTNKDVTVFSWDSLSNSPFLWASSVNSSPLLCTVELWRRTGNNVLRLRGLERRPPLTHGSRDGLLCSDVRWRHALQTSRIAVACKCVHARDFCKCSPVILWWHVSPSRSQRRQRLAVGLVMSRAVKMCITPLTPQGPCIFMGLPLTSTLRLSCGLSEQRIQWGRGLGVSAACAFAERNVGWWCDAQDRILSVWASLWHEKFKWNSHVKRHRSLLLWVFLSQC